MSTHNIGFNEDLTKIIFELSSSTHLISSAALSLSLPRKSEVRITNHHNMTSVVYWGR